MTPAASGWTEADYYRASRAARRASERSCAQLQIEATLEEGIDAREPAALPADGSPSISSSSVRPTTPQSLPGREDARLHSHRDGVAYPGEERDAVREENDR